MELIKMNLHTVSRRGIFYGLVLMLLVAAAGASDLTLSGDAHVNSARPGHELWRDYEPVYREWKYFPADV